MLKKTLPLLALVGASSAALAGPTETWAYSLVGVSNIGSPGTGIHELDGHGSTGPLVTANASQSFTGLNGAGTTQTMGFSGTTASQANFGRLRVKTAATLTNSYYNAGNALYVQNDGSINAAGSPDSLTSLGFAGFNDTLQFHGIAENGYTARYVFHIDGTNSGPGALADLSVKIGDDADESYFFGESGYSTQNVGTISHQISLTGSHEIHVQFSTQTVFDTPILTDGSNYASISDFSSTATLDEIQVFDANGARDFGVTVTSASGTVYPVPEPASLAALAGGVVALCRRRRRALGR